MFEFLPNLIADISATNRTVCFECAFIRAGAYLAKFCPDR